MRISKKTKMIEILRNNPKAAEILINEGLGCVFCPLAQQETLEQGCLAHRVNKKQIEKIIKKLNEK